jgi:unsaturated rhamnogalacturonyl hydrolase
MGKGELLGQLLSRILKRQADLQITLAIPMFLELVQLPTTDPVYRVLISTLTRQVDALLPLQDPKSGLWRTLLVDPTSYVEVSATAGFVGGILKAIRAVSPPYSLLLTYRGYCRRKSTCSLPLMD